MPRLSRVQVTYDLQAPHAIAAMFITSAPLFDTTDTSVLRLLATGGADLELTIRLERHRVSDAHLWNGRAARRLSLPTDAIWVAENHVLCSVDARLMQGVHYLPQVKAQLLVNGALIDARFPVEIAPSRSEPQFRTVSPERPAHFNRTITPTESR